MAVYQQESFWFEFVAQKLKFYIFEPKLHPIYQHAFLKVQLQNFWVYAGRIFVSNCVEPPNLDMHRKKQRLNYSIKVLWTKVNTVSTVRLLSSPSCIQVENIFSTGISFSLLDFFRKSGQVIRSIISEVNPVSIEKSQFVSKIDIVRLKFHRVFTASWIYRFPVG